MLSFLEKPFGLTAAEPLSIAWVCSVPSQNNLDKPAWPQMLDSLRSLQLEDGGFGEQQLFNVYDRFICTLAAIWALSQWDNPKDRERIDQARVALDCYGEKLLQSEVRDLVGFEFTVNKFINDLSKKGIIIDVQCLKKFSEVRKLASNSKRLLKPDINKPEAWWFCIECLPDEILIDLPSEFISKEAGIFCSTASTAAYLTAVRRNHQDSVNANHYLSEVMALTKNGIGFCWPFDNTQLIWSIDSYLKIGLEPNSPLLKSHIETLYKQWIKNDGIAFSPYFPVQDGDDVTVAYSILAQAEYEVSIEPILKFWNGYAISSYIGERETSTSLSVNLHALQAFREAILFRKENSHDAMISKILEWVEKKLKTDLLLVDKWHISPVYCLSRAIPILSYFSPDLTNYCIDRLLKDQRNDGGWGYFNHSSEEETAHSVIALLSAHQANLLKSDEPLVRAAQFLYSNQSNRFERPGFWFAKSLNLPVNMVEGLIRAAHLGLERTGINEKFKI